MSLSQHHLLHELSASASSQTLADTSEITSSANATSSSDHHHANSNENENNNNEHDKDGVNESCLHCYLSHFIIGDLQTQLQSVFTVSTDIIHIQGKEEGTQFEPLTDRNKSPPITI